MAKTLKLLLVEDSARDADAAVRGLESAGFAVAYRRVHDEATLLAALRSRWDAIVSEHVLAAFEGMRVLQMVRQHDPVLPFIFLCAELDAGTAVDAMREGAAYCLVKSDLPRLGAVIAREIAEAEDERTRQAAVNAVSFQQRRYQSIFESAPVALLELDMSSARRFLDTYADPAMLGGERPGRELIRSALERVRVLGANAVAVELLGAEPGQLPGLPSVIGDEGAWVDILDGLRGPPATLAREVAFTVAQGRQLDVLLTLKVPSEPGALRSVVVSLIDLSDRKALEHQVQAAQRLEAAGKLAGVVAHDFNNLLTVIKGYVGLLLDAAPASGPLARDLRAIDEAASSAEQLTRQLLAFGRRQRAEPQVQNVNDLLDRLAKVLPRMVGDRIEVSLDLARDLWPVEIDPGELEQVVMNLTMNARDAMPEGGGLVIATRNAARTDTLAFAGLPAGDYVMLSVSDSGCGMDDDVRLRVFEPFFTTKDPGRGTGLGLSTVYGIVTQARGAIRVISAPGRGSTFQILLPRHHG